MKIILIVFLILFFIPLLHSDEIDSLLVDSSKAFSENKTEEGLILLDKAAQIAESRKNAKACLRVGSAYIDLPSELERKSFAVDILKKGAGFAIEGEKWPMLGDFAMALQHLGEKDSAIEMYDEIFLKAGELRDKETISVLETRYNELGDKERVDICRKMIEALTIPPPPNWKPLGETVRGPKESTDVTGQVQSQIASQQVQKTMEYFIEKKRLEQQKKNKPMSNIGPYQY